MNSPIEISGTTTVLRVGHVFVFVDADYIQRPLQSVEEKRALIDISKKLPRSITAY